jgi:hypothetical protein
MGWVRFHRRYGAWPGLAALALQLVLSFGHIHIGNVHLNGAAQAASHAAGATAVTSQHVTLAQVSNAQASNGQVSKKLPAQNSGDDDDYCAICASIFLASTTFVADAPQLPVPVGFERIALTFDADQGMTAPPRYVLFQSRAPPAA